ncbi:MAG TPA: sialate O-acetylesterase [Polyangiaceae bacterium]|nr:sialate O-acetylesterase [Polyangiaceae bacterium]
MSRFPLALAAVFSLLPIRTAFADVRLPALVSDGMVLQTGVPARLWGWAAEGEKVTVTLRGQTASAEAHGGQWSVTLKPLPPGGPFEMTIAGHNTIVVKDVAIGEVWVCSGQSNMEFQLERSANAKPDIDAPPDPLLRMFTVGQQLADKPAADVASGAWERATPAARGHFSAVGYYFGRALRASRQVPVGLIHSSWGGTPAEAWTSRSVLTEWGLPAEAFAKLAPPSAAAREAYEKRLAVWTAAGRPAGTFEDPGVSDAAKTWMLPQTDTRGWSSMALPLAWEKVNAELEIDGGVWFRKEVTLPAKWAGQELELSLGAIDDTDTTYFNGALVGSVGADVPTHWQVARRYRIPAASVRAGRAVVAVRVWDHGGEGGFMGPAGELWIAPANAEAAERVSLGGDWRYRVERARPTMPNPPGLDSKLPTVLYNGMIAPLLPYTIRGATWYQGESNTARASEYRSLLTAMIQNWRSDWHSGNFPFLIAQLAPYQAIEAEPRESAWAELREAQARVAQEVDGAALAVITDVGDEKDIHPTQKKPVGERLALAARKVAYGEKIVASGPTLRSATLEGGKIVVRFDNVGKGLKVRGDRLTGFAIAGKDEKFVNAQATLEGDHVVVSSSAITAPAYVRFGWANYPVVNLWNADGLPAVPFRTDPH